jgi:hypothetical protein
MLLASFADVGAALWVFGSFQVAEVLELVIGLHVIINFCALPMCRLKVSVFGAFFGDFYFAVSLSELCIDFFLAFWTNALGLTDVMTLPICEISPELLTLMEAKS